MVQESIRPAAFSRFRAVAGLAFWAVLGPMSSASTSPDDGVPYIRHFPPLEIGGGPQVLDGVMAPDGSILFTSNRSILRYDGVEWSNVRVPTARRLAVDEVGRVWVGCDADFGYLELDGRAPRFLSLREELPEADRPVQRIQSTVAVGTTAVFVFTRQVIQWSADGVEIWRAEAEEEFEAAVAWEGQVYLFQHGRGLMRWPQEAAASALGAEVDGKVETILPTGEGDFLLGTNRGKIYRWRRGEVATFSTAAEDRLRSSSIRQLVRLRDSADGRQRIAVASRGAGLLVLDAEGGIEYQLSAAHGLPGDEIYGIVEDAQGSLWLGTSPGIARLSSAPITFYNFGPQSPKSLLRVERHRGSLYIGGIEGAYRLEASPGPDPARFVPITGLETVVSRWAVTPRGLMASTQTGLFEIDGDRAQKLTEKGRAMVWAEDDGAALVADGDLLRVMLPESGSWRFIDHPGLFPERIYEIHPEGPGAFWLFTPGSRMLFRLTFADGLRGEPQLESFETLAPWPRPLWVDGRLGVRDGLEVFFWEETADGGRLLPDPRFALADWIPEDEDRYELRATSGGDIWLMMRNRADALEKGEDGSFRQGSRSIAFASRLNFDTHADPDHPNVLWIATDLGPARFDTDFLPPAGVAPRVRFLPPATETTPAPTADGHPVVPHSAEALRFEVAAPYYLAEALTEYRFRLIGLSETWSGWSGESFKEFTNLAGDDYRFQAQARNAGLLLGESELAFRVLPPWHQTWWFRVLVVAGLAGLIGLFVRRQRRKVERERAIAEHERSLNRRLQAVDKLKDEFLANTSHELRTPLYGITGLAESLIDGAAGSVSEPMHENLAMIVSSGRRLSNLVNDILDFSKLKHHSLRLDLRPVELHALVDVVLGLLRPLVGSKQLRLENAVAADLPVALGDENRLQQILQNLVGNAIKFTEQGEIEVTAKRRDDRLEISVRDTGIGIAPAQQNTIFEAFEQADGTIERQFDGTGLGLAVTRQLVELHGGALGVDSTVGEGSRFFFDLPISESEIVSGAPSAEPSTDSARPPAIVDGKDRSPVAAEPEKRDSADGTRILVVDDEPVNLQVLSNQLTAEGYLVARASGGQEALDQVASWRPDLILLDVMMPRMSGYEVCHELRRSSSIDELPILFLTARSQSSDLVVGLTAGANDYLPKPISKSELLARVKTHLGLRAVHQELSQLVDERTAQVEEHQRLLRERERLIEELEAKNAELVRFNYTVSHDLKNPLTTIKNFLGLARQDAADGDADGLEHDLDRLQTAADRLHLLLEELYEFSKVGIQANPLLEVPLEELMAELLVTLDDRIAERGARVEVVSELPVVLGDRPRLEELLRHLIENALRYSDPSRPPRIEIGMRSLEGESIFFVRDNGLGIESRYHEKIFDLFDRLDPESSQGTGIGLALAKRIVELHGGQIWVESQGPGQGSTFCFTLSRGS